MLHYFAPLNSIIIIIINTPTAITSGIAVAQFKKKSLIILPSQSSY